MPAAAAAALSAQWGVIIGGGFIEIEVFMLTLPHTPEFFLGLYQQQDDHNFLGSLARESEWQDRIGLRI